MAIRLRKSFKRFYFKRFIFKLKIKNYNKFLLRYRASLPIRIKKKKKKNLPFFKHKQLVERLYKRGYKKRYFFSYLFKRVEFIRIRKSISKFQWRNRKKFWKKKYRKGIKFVYFKYLSKKFSKDFMQNNKIRHYNLLSQFYKKKGFYYFLKNFVKYSRLKYILSKYGKVLKNKKKITRKVFKDRIEKLSLLNDFFQILISSGKKKLSLKIFFNLFVLLKFKYKLNFLDTYIHSLENIRPLICYKVIYIGGKKYRIPTLMPVSKSYMIAVRWLLSNCSEGHLVISLYNHINSSFKNEGSVVKFRKEYHLVSFENKSYIRFLKFLKSGF